MASPSVIVAFVDADGDEFPVRVWGEFNASQQRTLNRLAKAEFKRLCDSGDFRPKQPVVMTTAKES